MTLLFIIIDKGIKVQWVKRSKKRQMQPIRKMMTSSLTPSLLSLSGRRLLILRMGSKEVYPGVP